MQAHGSGWLMPLMWLRSTCRSHDRLSALMSSLSPLWWPVMRVGVPPIGVVRLTPTGWRVHCERGTNHDSSIGGASSFTTIGSGGVGSGSAATRPPGMLSTVPGRRLRSRMRLASTTVATDTPYCAAMDDSVSPVLTVCCTTFDGWYGAPLFPPP